MTNEVIEFPDAIAVVVNALTAGFVTYNETATVHSRVPDPRPDRFVIVQRTGGPRLSLVTDGAQLTIDAWGTGDVDAQQLAQLSRALLHAISCTRQGNVTVYHINEFSGPGYSPDPESGQARFTFTVQVVTRGDALVPTR